MTVAPNVTNDAGASTQCAVPRLLLNRWRIGVPVQQRCSRHAHPRRTGRGMREQRQLLAMDAFVTKRPPQTKRKRQTPSPSPPPPPVECQDGVERAVPLTYVLDDSRGEGADGPENEDDEPTEVKLAMLASLISDGDSSIGQDVLLDMLSDHKGSVAAAAAAWQSRPRRWTKRPKSVSGSVIGRQTSLRTLFASSYPDGALSPEKPAGPATALQSRRGRTLFLYDPVDVAAHTPCTLVHNFLPANMANDLLREMLAEAVTFGSHTFKLFDQVVSSPHTSCFYLAPAAEAAAAAQAGAGNTTSDTFVLTADTHADYRYSGSRLSDIRTTTPHMSRVRPLVEDAVNRAIQQRIVTHYPEGRKLRHQNRRPWMANAAIVNCYRGAQENVGWHSDQLTYLGPRAVIGSLSLGVAREFRVRRIVPRDGAKEDVVLSSSSSSLSPKSRIPLREEDAAGQISIHLPHNSLLVMHAEMQEEWKHCVAPTASIDPHPIAGNRRINITYRDYRAEFHPNLTPRCRCGIATVLRVVQRKHENHGRYFWMCHAGNIPGREGCTFFKWADFDDDGRPIWKSKDKNTMQSGQGRAAEK